MTERPLEGREVLLIVGGGIAAYKSVALAREILRAGGTVETVLTAAAQRFVTGVTFAAITGRAARTDLWDPGYPGELHVELTRRADAVVVAPATADLIARAAHGLADDLATTCLIAARGRVMVVPAMHPRMWEHSATRANVATLAAREVCVFGPVDGPLASGESGMGRMAEPDAVVDAVAGLFAPRDLSGVRVMVTAGPTHEAIDPVRFLGNRSSGRMGFAVAARARDRGAVVTLVAGPVAIDPPWGVTLIRVRSAQEMHDVVVPRAAGQDVVVMAAAVADYRPAHVSPDKIKKAQDEVILQLVRNPDILGTLGAARGEGRRPLLVGFAVETRDLVPYARDKLARKRCDLVVANLAAEGFEGSDNTVTLVSVDGAETLARQSKTAVAGRILDAVRDLLASRQGDTPTVST